MGGVAVDDRDTHIHIHIHVHLLPLLLTSAILISLQAPSLLRSVPLVGILVTLVRNHNTLILRYGIGHRVAIHVRGGRRRGRKSAASLIRNSQPMRVQV
jgi:hypothetical protein